MHEGSISSHYSTGSRKPWVTKANLFRFAAETWSGQQWTMLGFQWFSFRIVKAIWMSHLLFICLMGCVCVCLLTWVWTWRHAHACVCMCEARDWCPGISFLHPSLFPRPFFICMFQTGSLSQVEAPYLSQASAARPGLFHSSGGHKLRCPRAWQLAYLLSSFLSVSNKCFHIIEKWSNFFLLVSEFLLCGFFN